MDEYSLQVFYKETTTVPKRKEHTIISAINDYEFGGLTQDEVASKYDISSKTLRAWIRKYYNSELEAIVFGDLPRPKPIENIPVRPTKPTDVAVEETKEVDPFCAMAGSIKELMKKDIF